LKIPQLLRPRGAVNIAHITAFKAWLPSVIPTLKKSLENCENESVFFPTVGDRGRCLHNGAYVLQLRVEKEALDVWSVKFLVGASYSYQTHTGYFQLSKNSAPVCKYMLLLQWVSLCDRRNVWPAFIFWILILNFRERPCSHLNAVFRLLVDWMAQNSKVKM
jgi:hypothetical protein